jgi:hypothetical protein
VKPENEGLGNTDNAGKVRGKSNCFMHCYDGMK